MTQPSHCPDKVQTVAHVTVASRTHLLKSSDPRSKANVHDRTQNKMLRVSWLLWTLSLTKASSDAVWNLPPPRHHHHQDTQDNAVGLAQPSPHCWTSSPSIAKLLHNVQLDTTSCDQLSHQAQTQIALELARCHVSDLQQPLCLDESSCLTTLTAVGTLAYTSYIVFVQQVCTRLTHELQAQRLADQHAVLVKQYASMLETSLQQGGVWSKQLHEIVEQQLDRLWQLPVDYARTQWTWWCTACHDAWHQVAHTLALVWMAILVYAWRRLGSWGNIRRLVVVGFCVPLLNTLPVSIVLSGVGLSAGAVWEWWQGWRRRNEQEEDQLEECEEQQLPVTRMVPQVYYLPTPIDVDHYNPMYYPETVECVADDAAAVTPLPTLRRTSKGSPAFILPSPTPPRHHGPVHQYDPNEHSGNPPFAHAHTCRRKRAEEPSSSEPALKKQRFRDA